MQEFMTAIKNFKPTDLWNDDHKDIQITLRVITFFTGISLIFGPLIWTIMPGEFSSLAFYAYGPQYWFFLLVGSAAHFAVALGLKIRHPAAWIGLVIISSQGLFSYRMPVSLFFLWWISRPEFRALLVRSPVSNES